MLAAADAAVAAASALALAAAATAIGYPFSSSIYRFGERRENALKVLHNPISGCMRVCLHGCFRCMCNGLVSSTYELRRVLFYRLQ